MRNCRRLGLCCTKAKFKERRFIFQLLQDLHRYPDAFPKLNSATCNRLSPLLPLQKCPKLSNLLRQSEFLKCVIIQCQKMKLNVFVQGGAIASASYVLSEKCGFPSECSRFSATSLYTKKSYARCVLSFFFKKE